MITAYFTFVTVSFFVAIAANVAASVTTRPSRREMRKAARTPPPSEIHLRPQRPPVVRRDLQRLELHALEAAHVDRHHLVALGSVPSPWVWIPQVGQKRCLITCLLNV